MLTAQVASRFRLEVMSTVPIPLNDGRAIPRIGLGTWPLDDAEAERVAQRLQQERGPSTATIEELEGR